MAYADIDHPAELLVGPDDGVIAHGFVLFVSTFINRGQYTHFIARTFVKLVPLIRDSERRGQMPGGRVFPVLHQYRSLLKLRVRRIGNVAHKPFKPLPVAGIGS
jgi:hypothetical protein